MSMKTHILAIVIVLSLGAAAEAGDGVVARVNGSPIMEWQVQMAVDQIIPRASFHGTLSKERLAAYRERAIENLIAFELQYQYAVGSGIQPDKKKVRARMNQVRDSFPSKSEFKRWLDDIGQTEGQIVHVFEKESVVSAVHQVKIVLQATMKDEDVREYYERNRNKFKVPESFRLRIITTKERKKALEALAEVEGGGDFGGVAARFSEDDFRIKGGDLGYVHRGRIYPELEKQAFTLKVGAIGGPFEAQGKWFVVKIEDYKSAHVVPFEETREKLKSELEKKKRAELYEAWMSALRGKAVIEHAPASGSAGTGEAR